MLALVAASACTSASRPATSTGVTERAVVAPEVIRVVDGVVSAYLVRAADGTVVAVDCGLDPTGAALTAALAEHGLTPAAVRAVFVTHLHADHVGGCDLFAAPRYRLTPTADAPAEPLTDEAPVVVGGLTVTPFAVGGHSPDSTAFVIGDALFLGDAAGLDADRRVVAARWRFEGDTPVEDHDGVNQAALRRLGDRLAARRQPIARLYFGHAEPTTDVAALVPR